MTNIDELIEKAKASIRDGRNSGQHSWDIDITIELLKALQQQKKELEDEKAAHSYTLSTLESYIGLDKELDEALEVLDEIADGPWGETEHRNMAQAFLKKRGEG